MVGILVNCFNVVYSWFEFWTPATMLFISLDCETYIESVFIFHVNTLSHQQECVYISPGSQNSFLNTFIAIPSHNGKWLSLYLSNMYFPGKFVNAKEDFFTPMDGSLSITGDSSLLRCYSDVW